MTPMARIWYFALFRPVGMTQRYYAAKLIGKLTSTRSLRQVDPGTRDLPCVLAQVQHVQCQKRTGSGRKKGRLNISRRTEVVHPRYAAAKPDPKNLPLCRDLAPNEDEVAAVVPVQ